LIHIKRVRIYTSILTVPIGDIRKYLSTLISLAFTVISSDSVNMKKVGFSLIIVLVKLFRRTIEKISDDDEDQD
jgi:hypothetical protein